MPNTAQKNSTLILNIRHMRLTTTLATLTLALIISLYAIKTLAETSNTETKEQNQEELSLTNHNNLKDYFLIQEIVQSMTPKADSSTRDLALEVKLQAEKIKNLEKEVSELRKPDDNSMATLLLSAVSVIITVLGVLIAILAILGYRNIKNEAIKDARKTAKETVKIVAKEEIPRATEENIIKLIEENRFDRLIQNAVENIVYRDTSMSDEVADEERSN
ncbi:hypothetical protein [Pseudomonas zeae]|uniref:Uncharacterized protein n=1 Tax=Pseudomonas zeae TaxID=2745510 RepID=A0ABU5BF26_9PSED|nr:hypothetical protein [Pseudomonas zeae]MDX9675247.1 hypothetical protein [Pseudomonas zeae]